MTPCRAWWAMPCSGERSRVVRGTFAALTTLWGGMMLLKDSPEFHADLLTRYADLLGGAPYEVVGPFLDQAELLGRLQHGDLLAYLVGYAIEPFQSRDPQHFRFLTPQENQALSASRSFKLLRPWPQPVLRIGWNPQRGEGRILDDQPVRTTIHMQQIGEGQIWWGGRVGVLWEAFLARVPETEQGCSLPLLHGLWDLLEAFLLSRRVTRIVTLPHDPAYDPAFYQSFLSDRGYRRKDKAMVKVKQE